MIEYLMGKLGDFLTGTKILEQAVSPINGKISVVKGLGYGIYLQVGGLTQSGGVVKGVWRSTLRKVRSKKSKAKSCLILGLGAGSAAQLVKDLWPKAKITGVEIDPVMIRLGKKYLGLDEVRVDIKIQDASIFIKKAKTYDLILIDMYVGDQVPKKFETRKFVNDIKKLMHENSTVIFNRLYYGEKRPHAKKFGELLEQEFRQVIYHYPEANLMFICKK